MTTDKNKLKVKDLITTGIFTALYIIVVFISAMLFSAVPVLSMYTSCIYSMVTGVIFMYVALKVQKFGSITIMGILIGSFMFLAGHFWLCLIFMPATAVIGDLLCSRGKYKKVWWNTAGYASFCIGMTLCAYTPMLFFADEFVRTRIAMGMDEAYIYKFLELTRGPLLVFVFVLTVVCAVLGSMIARSLLRRHFEKRGAL